MSGTNKCFMCPNLIDESYKKPTGFEQTKDTDNKFYRIKTIDNNIVHFCSKICFDWYVKHKYNDNNNNNDDDAYNN